MHLRHRLTIRRPIPSGTNDASELFGGTAFPDKFWGFVIAIYQPSRARILVARAGASPAFENVRQAFNHLLEHERIRDFDLGSQTRCRMQVDFIKDEPQPIALVELSDSVLPEEQGRSSGLALSEYTRGLYTEPHHGERDGYLEIGAPWQMQMVSTWPAPKRLTRFEWGVDGLRIVKEGRRRYFLPGDAFVHSILGIAQLRRHIQRLFPGDDIDRLTCYRFRSISFVSGVERGSWLPLYRGLPPLPEVNRAALTRAARAGIWWIADNVQADRRFVYYYDAATDTRRDHEHPARDPETDPYYNLLRHGGGAITLLLDEELRRQSPDERPSGDAGIDHRRSIIEQSLDFYVDQLVSYEPQAGMAAAYALYNHKAKLGGSGIGLYALALYQRLFGDSRYSIAAKQLAAHLVSEINEQGEFPYYHIYLDQPVAWHENQRYFSFYYPGEAILGLSHYCQHVCVSDGERREIFAKTHQALRFLLRDRPRLHQEQYQALPSDSWLMMGVNDLWNEPEFQQDEYAQFVFDDADQMARLMYTEKDALYPDYVGSFYYRYGDHPFPDGARAEGLLAAYQLALRIGDRERIEPYRHACHQIASATLRLCNTPESVYSAANPERAIGGIRFKLTRQWFRVDTIQHVASFYLKLMMTGPAQ